MRWSNSSSFSAASARFALLGERKPPLLELVGRLEPVAVRRRLAEKRQRDEHDAAHGESRRDDERERHIRAGAPA